MKKTITTLMLLLTVAFLSFGQDPKPISPLFKNLQSPSFSFMIGGNPWIYRGSYFNPTPWTELAGWTNVKDTLNNYWIKPIIQAKIDSLANAKQDTITLTTTGTGAATFDGQILNIPTNSGAVSDTLKEDKANKVTSLSSSSTDIQYPSAKSVWDGLVSKEPTIYAGTTSQYLRGDKNWATLPTLYSPAQNLTSSTNMTIDYLSGSSGTITMTGNVTNLTFINMPDNAMGDWYIIQNSTGGYGITNIIHAGLTSSYPDPDGDNVANKPVAANINSGANRKTTISYHRVGSYLLITYGNYAE